jgi:TRAP-type C4-dicarboxylate transport system permease large subunit
MVVRFQVLTAASVKVASFWDTAYTAVIFVFRLGLICNRLRFYGWVLRIANLTLAIAPPYTRLLSVKAKPIVVLIQINLVILVFCASPCW